MQTRLIHGFTQTRASWRGVVEATGGGRVVAIDFERANSFEATIERLAATSNRSIWCGYSMGGRFALALAVAHPELVEHLILVSASPGLRTQAERAQRRAADELLAQRALHDGPSAFIEAWLAQPMFATIPANAPGIIERSAISSEQIASDLRVLGTGSMPSLWPSLAALPMPVTIVTADLDQKFTAIGDEMGALIVNAHRHRLPGGHAIPLEQPERLAAIIQDVHSAAAKKADDTI